MGKNLTSTTLEPKLLHSDLSAAFYLTEIARQHACANHPLFEKLASIDLTLEQAGKLLRNYDVHATFLRRLLLKVATIMPEEAVCFVLENVRTEYGSGKPEWRHQLQLQDLAFACGVDKASYFETKIEAGIWQFIQQATNFYYPVKQRFAKTMLRPAIAAGAITATELLAIAEFQALQKAFAKLGQDKHIWFNHVVIELEHSDESLALAEYFIAEHQARQAVEFGFYGVLEANCHLYDGLLAAIS